MTNLAIKYESDKPTCSARELHEFLGVDTAFKDWFPRMCQYGFAEGVDFNLLKIERVQPEGDRRVVRVVNDAQVTIDMAKELCMLQRTEKGKQVRLYLLEVEKQWNTPEAVMARALRMAQGTIDGLTGQVLALTAANSELAVRNAIMEPKAGYFDQMVDRNLLTNFRETAKQFKIKEKVFVGFLVEHRFIYRDKKGKLQPYADKNDGLFEVKECFNEKTGWGGTQTLITPKGRETFRLLMQGLMND